MGALAGTVDAASVCILLITFRFAGRLYASPLQNVYTLLQVMTPPNIGLPLRSFYAQPMLAVWSSKVQCVAQRPTL